MLCVKGIFYLKCLLIAFVLPNLSNFCIFVYQKSFKRTFQIGFWVRNHLLNLCSRIGNAKRLFCSKKLSAIQTFIITFSNQIWFGRCLSQLNNIAFSADIVWATIYTKFALDLKNKKIIVLKLNGPLVLIVNILKSNNPIFV